MLTEQTTIDIITVKENGIIEVRAATVVYRDDVEIARQYHRHVLAPGDDLSGEDDRVSAIATVTWTPEVIQAYQESIANEQP